MKLYVDFNSINVCNYELFDSCVDLTGYGTIASLNLLKIKLEEEQTFDLYDSDGLAVVGKTFFDNTKLSENCLGWFAAFYKKNLSELDPDNVDFNTFICFNCRNNISSYLDVSGRNYKELCPHCNTPVTYALFPPGKSEY